MKFPIEDLDLSSYADEDTSSSSNTTYHLYGISHHSGYMSGGHNLMLKGWQQEIFSYQQAFYFLEIPSKELKK